MQKPFWLVLMLTAMPLTVSVPIAVAAPKKSIEPQAKATFERALKAYKAIPALRFEARDFTEINGKDAISVVGILGRGQLKLLIYGSKTVSSREPRQLEKVEIVDGLKHYQWNQGKELRTTIEPDEMASIRENIWFDIPFVEFLNQFWSGTNPLNAQNIVSATLDKSGQEDKVILIRALKPDGCDSINFTFNRKSGLLSSVTIRRENIALGMEIISQQPVNTNSDTFKWSPKNK